MKFHQKSNMPVYISGHFTGKSLSEVLIYLSMNPKYDNKLFNDLRVQYKKILRAEHVENMSNVKNMSFTQIVLNL